MSAEIKKGLLGIVVDETTISHVVPELSALTYRGYKVQDLCDKCDFEEVAYLVLHGELPSKVQLKKFIKEETKDARQWIFNRNLTVHTATSKHWKDYWDITDSENRFIKSIEGYFFEKNDPSRDVTLDTHIAYYNFDRIDERL